MMKRLSIRTFVSLLLVLLLAAPAALAKVEIDDLTENRLRLISYALREQLQGSHYSKKSLDDALSRDAFKLYLEQLDYQKRFLLEKDVKVLEAYSERMDDEMRRGRLQLPLVGAEILEQRIGEVEAMVEKLLAKGFDFKKREMLETDAEKLPYARTLDELQERWRKSLKYQVMSRYLGLLDDEGIEEPAAADKKTLETLRAKALEKVAKSYDTYFSRLRKETYADHADRYFNAVARAFDPHTGYLPPAKREDFDISMRGSLEGIGATLREEDGYIKVVAIIPGSPAAAQGQLQAEDIILKVAEAGAEPVDITDTRIRDAVSYIRGPKGTEVRLTVRKPDGARLVIPIVRDVVQIEATFVKSTVLQEGDRRFGFIRIPSFYRDFEDDRHDSTGRNVTDDVKAELESLKRQGVTGVILDLRNNGGGSLSDAVSVSGLFIEKGPVVQVKDSFGRSRVLRDKDSSVAYDGPLVVLVNQFSASASEILAGALQDYGRALVVGGEHTHGKGTVQAILDLDQSLNLPGMDKYKPLGALKLTIQKFYRVSGDSTQYRGVVPDVVLPDRLSHIKSGEQFLDFSLPWDRTEKTDYQRWGGTPLDLPRLISGSRSRISSSEDFREILTEATEAKARAEKTQVALDIEEMLRERRELKEKGAASLHGDMAEAAEFDEPALDGMSEEENQNAWIEETAEDPYVLEGMALLSDLIAQEGEFAGASRPAVGKTN